MRSSPRWSLSTSSNSSSSIISHRTTPSKLMHQAVRRLKLSLLLLFPIFPIFPFFPFSCPSCSFPALLLCRTLQRPPMKLPPQMKAIPPPRIGTPTSPPPPAAQPATDAALQNGGGGVGGVAGNGATIMDDATLPPPPLEAQQTHLANTVDATPPKSRAQAANGKPGNGLALHNGGGGAAVAGGAAVGAGGAAGVVMDDDDDLPPPPPAITDESNYAVTEL